mgnify:CR=1 FL=1
MKSNLAILSSDIKSINFIHDNKLTKFCNLYANCSRNVGDAEKFSSKYNFTKYYGSYEELLEDKDIDFVINFLPSGIKFEYNYLSLKKGIKVITNYPIISSISEISFFSKIIKNGLISNLFLIDDCNIKKLYNESHDYEHITYYKNINESQILNNSLLNTDILFELCPDLFFFINKYRENNIKIKINNTVKDKITNKINYLNCIIKIDSKVNLQVILDNSSYENKHLSYTINNFNEINDFLFNKKDLINFINSKKPFDNLSDFQYYPFKLFQEVFNE